MDADKLKGNIEEFIKKINKYGNGIVMVIQDESEPDEFIRFQLVLKSNILIDYGTITPSDYFITLVKKLGSEIFGVEAGFNNTKTTFWFYLVEQNNSAGFIKL